MLKILLPLLFLALSSCGQTPQNHRVDSRAIALNYDIVPLFNYYDNVDSCKKALSLLDKATAIDNNYFLGHYNKLTFLYSLKQFDKAILTVNNLIRLKPKAHDLYLMQGILYEKIKDSVSSRPYFERSLVIANLILDTMNERRMDYSMIMCNKAISLIMLGDNAKANQVIETLNKAQTDEDAKKLFLTMIKKSKKELLEYLTIDPSSR